jgi:divalent metal cation (Fe/Co/Zn/Cd) transporter
VDVTRSRILYKAAKKYNSQALEADALHFKTDIWSSSVVILGLVGVRSLRQYLRCVPALRGCSGCLGVALIVIFISIELGMRTIQGLLDAAPKGAVEQVRQTVEAVPGVVDCTMCVCVTLARACLLTRTSSPVAIKRWIRRTH